MNLTAEQLVERIQKALDATKADIAYHEARTQDHMSQLKDAFNLGDLAAAASHRDLACFSRTAMNEAVRAADRLSRILVDAGVTKGGGQ